MFWPNCSIIRQMSRYYHIHEKGVEIYARPSNFWRKTLLRNIPNLTGDFAPINILIKGHFDTSVKYIKIIYEYNGFEYDESPKYPPGKHNYSFCGKRLDDSGLYKVRLLIATDKSEVQERLWQHEPNIALIQVIDDWKPVIWLWTLIIGAILATIITILIQKLLGII